MGNNVVNFNLYGEPYSPLLPNFVHSERLEDRLHRIYWTIEPHLHTDLFQLILIETGQLTTTLGASKVHLQAPCLQTIPVDVLHSCQFTKDVTGSTLLLSNSYLDTIFNASPAVLVTLNQAQIIQSNTDEEAFGKLAGLVEQVHDELFDNRPERSLAIQAGLSLLLLEIYRLVHLQKTDQQATSNRILAYFRSFQFLIKEHVRHGRSIQQYAEELGITPVHLNRVCRQVVNQSALEVVQDHVLSEAKRYLLHSSYTISEIAYLLNFDDPNYFTRLFRKRLGVSPRTYREKTNPLDQKIGRI
ncbi:AraC family transcriptional regulator [Telluribacter humicola]|uniref:AraC family transcriptional regulator n=1 Tax=Telluribacter humicola TaxID=1720261 RepID=UPI001A978B65|nr:helix-turn-helix domain-containing protein [Telluribacter humicola]